MPNKASKLAIKNEIFYVIYDLFYKKKFALKNLITHLNYDR